MLAANRNTNFTGLKNQGRFRRYAPLIFWVIVIFIFSSNAGSMSNTSLFLRPVLEFLFPNYSEAELVVIHGYIRKAAHFGLYAVLGTLAARVFAASFNQSLRRNWFLASFALTVFIASLDEINQSFLNSRTGSAYDVLLDIAGSLTALLIFYAAASIVKK